MQTQFAQLTVCILTQSIMQESKHLIRQVKVFIVMSFAFKLLQVSISFNLSLPLFYIKEKLKIVRNFLKNDVLSLSFNLSFDIAWLF